jgi:hypothetical protein
MAYDACTDLLYVSDGRQTTVRRQSPLAICDFPEVRCCTPSPSAQTWHGFDIEPQPARSVGSSCMDPACGNCPNTTLETVGDASVGNPFFALRVRGGPAGQFAALALSGGPCAVPGLPALCGTWHLPNPFFLPGQQLTSSTPARCDGTATWALPLPKLWALCQVRLCAQVVVLCQSPAGIGAGLTNALDIPFSN